MRCADGPHRAKRTREAPTCLIEKYLTERNYKHKAHPPGQPLDQMEPGTFTFRLNVKVRNSQTDDKAVNIPVDAVIQPITATLPHLPVLIEAKSAQGRLW